MPGGINMKKFIASLLIVSSIISSNNFVSSSMEKNHKKYKYGEKILILRDNSFI